MYGSYIDILELTGWTWDELQDQPADLIDEMLIRLSEKAQEIKRQNKQSRSKGRH